MGLFKFNELQLGTEGRDKFQRLMQSNVRERFEKFVEILFQIHIQFASSKAGRSERIAVLFDRIADAMLEGADFGDLERLVNKLKTMTDSEVLGETIHQKSVDYILEHWGQEAFVQRVLDPVFKNDKQLVPASIGIVSKLSASAVPALSHHCCRISDPRVRAHLWRIIAKHIRGHEVNIARLIVSASIPISREVLSLLADNVEPEDLGKLLLNGLRNSEVAVRLETMSIVEKVGAQHASSLLIRALVDVESAVRGKALHLLARQRDLKSIKPVWDIISSSRFTGFALDEKRRFCVTYALCGGALIEWQKLLSARSLIESYEMSELKHCALVAMGVQMDSQITDLVHRYTSRKKQTIVTEAAVWVEQHINCPREERTRQLYALFYSGKLVQSRRGDA